MKRTRSYRRRIVTTHCVHGHAYTPENTRTDGDGRRQCRECNRAAVHRYQEKQRSGDPSVAKRIKRARPAKAPIERPNDGREWRSLAWLPEFEISEDGKHLRRTQPARGEPIGTIAHGFIDQDGYRRFGVRVADKYTQRIASRMVCEAWHGPPPFEGAQAAHWDGDKANNHYSNLRWATNRENADDRVRHGTNRSGDMHPRARLSSQQVRAIRQSRGQKSALRWSRELGIPLGTIKSASCGKTWKAIK